MTKIKLLKTVKELEKISLRDDPNASKEAHHMADKALLEFIGDERISHAFAIIYKCYA